jgi:hypothetical protein
VVCAGDGALEILADQLKAASYSTASDRRLLASE